jgi:hypothetical protein
VINPLYVETAIETSEYWYCLIAFSPHWTLTAGKSLRANPAALRIKSLTVTFTPFSAYLALNSARTFSILSIWTSTEI